MALLFLSFFLDMAPVIHVLLVSLIIQCKFSAVTEAQSELEELKCMNDDVRVLLLRA